MSTANPPRPPVTETGRPDRAPVIRRMGGVGETDRLLTRHLPAWVASGLLNFGLIALAWLVFGFQPAPVKTAEKVLTTSVEREREEVVQNLENEDTGFDSSIPAALPDIEKVAEQTVDMIVADEPIGVPDATAQANNAAALPGVPADAAAGGAPGLSADALVGPGGANGDVMATFPGRSGATKTRLLREGGGNDDSERAVADGLAWLAAQQKAGGYWEFDPPGRGGEGNARKLDRTTATGLALLPFLAAGSTHKSPSSRYAKKIDAGLRYLVDHMDKSTGKFDSPSGQYMYGHGIATMALCEAYGMTKDPYLKGPAQKAVNFIIASQAGNGSWGYQPGVAGDTSIVGWQLQALQAARLAKLTVSDATVGKAVKFLDSVSSGSRRAVYGYAAKNGAPGTSLTAVGLLCRYYMDGWGPGNAGMAEGVSGLFGTPRPGAGPDDPRTNRERAPKTKAEAAKGGAVPDMYYYYYATQVVHFFEGPEWKEWNEGPKDRDGKRLGGMRDWLVGLQRRDAPAVKGSWDPDPGTIGPNCGRLGTTCLCLLTLEVYYRHLPLYKRDTGGQVLDQVK
ncbi:MAG: terpene cyclase/mutase family protein [Gemmataceae bacterium]|nr:terpene cyclase/mutase family protein [Gemmataceae bacterium]